jgi:hypothetical protein
LTEIKKLDVILFAGTWAHPTIFETDIRPHDGPGPESG